METNKKTEADIGKVFANAWGLLKSDIRTFIVSSVIFSVVFSFLYGIWRLPFIDFGFTRMSAIGFIDVAYLLAIVIMSGILVTLIRYKVKSSSKHSKLGGLGAIFAGFVAATCPVCQGITIAALGGTLAFIPLGILSPFIWIFQLVALFILWVAIYLNSVSIYTKTCITCEIKPHKPAIKPSSTPGLHFPDNNKFFAAMSLIVVLVVANQVLISNTGLAFAAGASSQATVTLSEGFNYGPKLTLKPMPLASGEQPRIAGYKTAVKGLPTISELEIKSSTGDVVQDLVNNIIPTGTPWYGEETGISFDDPVTAQQLWGRAGGLQLSAEEEARWGRIVNSFTCDYCCGSPQQPTIITRCGCAHSIAAQGMAKWFIKNYGDKYSDEEIYGEMARWYALWYPGPTVQRIAQEMGLN